MHGPIYPSSPVCIKIVFPRFASKLPSLHLFFLFATLRNHITLLPCSSSSTLPPFCDHLKKDNLDVCKKLLTSMQSQKQPRFSSLPFSFFLWFCICLVGQSPKFSKIFKYLVENADFLMQFDNLFHQKYKEYVTFKE